MPRWGNGKIRGGGFLNEGLLESGILYGILVGHMSLVNRFLKIWSYVIKI